MTKYIMLFVLLMLCFGKSHAEDRVVLPDEGFTVTMTTGAVIDFKVTNVKVVEGAISEFAFDMSKDGQLVGDSGIDCGKHVFFVSKSESKPIPPGALEELAKHYCGVFVQHEVTADSLAAAQFVFKQEKASKAQLDAKDNQRRQREDQNAKRKLGDEAKVVLQDAKAQE